jgi:hypothetical protein
MDEEFTAAIKNILRSIKEVQALGWTSTDVILYEDDISDCIENMLLNAPPLKYVRNKNSFEISWPKDCKFT